jgi:uncharacterized protein
MAMLDLMLIGLLGFLGSFGHCLGMCGPLATALLLSERSRSRLGTLLLLNGARLVSYALVGAGIGAIGSVLIAGGQLAGIGSDFRRILAIVTGLLLVFLGLGQVWPRFGLWVQRGRSRAMIQLGGGLVNERLHRAMVSLSSPVALGLLWGLMPCGFLYQAQVKAAETGDPLRGALVMMAFGLGTMPMMLGVGQVAQRLSRSRRSQLFRLGGWVTLVIGLVTLLRTSEMVDYTGYGAILLLALALVARPLSGLWPGPLRYRRSIGVGAFFLVLAHLTHAVSHNFDWNLAAVTFMVPSQQWGLGLGIGSTVCMLPGAVTSFDGAVKFLGVYWRKLHLLALPALLLAGGHILWSGSGYLGGFQMTAWHWGRVLSLNLGILVVLLLRSSLVWKLIGLETSYVWPKR